MWKNWNATYYFYILIRSASWPPCPATRSPTPTSTSNSPGKREEGEGPVGAWPERTSIRFDDVLCLKINVKMKLLYTFFLVQNWIDCSIKNCHKQIWITKKQQLLTKQSKIIVIFQTSESSCVDNVFRAFWSYSFVTIIIFVIVIGFF